MNGAVAIATSDPDWFTVIRMHLEVAGVAAADLAEAPLMTAGDAGNWIATGDRRLLVLDAGMPIDPQKRRDESSTLVARDILERLRGRLPSIPVLIIVPSLAAAAAFEQICSDIGDALTLPNDILGKHWELILRPFLAMLLQPSLDKTPAKKGAREGAVSGSFRIIEAELLRDKVEVRLGTGDGAPLLLWNTQTRLEELKQAARVYDTPEVPDGSASQGAWGGVKPPSNWLEQSRVVGTTLFRFLVVDAIGAHCFSRIERAAGGLKGLSFRFVINEVGYYAAPFEASVRYLQSEENGPFVLLYAPLVRRVLSQVRLQAMLQDTHIETGATVLFVRSQLGEYPGEPRDWMEFEGLWFAKLGNIDVEREYLRELHRAGKIQLREVNLSEAAPGEAMQMFFDEVNRHKPDILHYAGHAWSDGRGSAKLILPGSTQNKAMGLTLDRMAAYDGLAETKLVYLSACRGISKGSVQHLVMHGIPYALGFRWSVEDHRAPKFAKAFYDELCANRSVSHAFCRACWASWRQLERDDESPIWISPILLAQSTDWATRHDPPPASTVPVAVAITAAG